MVTVIPGGVVALATALLAGTPAGGWVGFIGVLIVLGLSTWVAVRLSLLAPHTFMIGHIDPRAAWLLTHGQFWKLLCMVVIVIVSCIGVSILGATVSSLVGALLGSGLEDDIPRSVGGNPRVILALLANLLLAPVFLTLQAVIVTAAPAAAYGQLARGDALEV